MFKNILALYDFSKPSLEALKWAVSMASHLNARLKVLHVFGLEPNPLIPDLELQAQEMQIRLERTLEKTVQQLLKTQKKKPRSVFIDVPSGNPTSVILEVIGKDDPDLVILGARGRTNLEHILLGSVAEKVLRQSPSPVWTVRGSQKWPPRKILAPVDLQEFTSEAVTISQKLARAFKASLELLHVVSIPDIAPMVPELGGVWPSNLLETLKKDAEKQLQKLIPHRSNLEVTAKVTIGPVADEICRRASRDHTDLIVTPTHGRTGLSHLLMGSVAESVVRHAPCHVLTFCPPKVKKHRKKLLLR